MFPLYTVATVNKETDHSSYICKKDERTYERAGKKKGSCRMYTMSDVPEYKEISDQWLVAENELTVYRDRCMKEGIKLFARYFRDLWD